MVREVLGRNLIIAVDSGFVGQSRHCFLWESDVWNVVSIDII